MIRAIKWISVTGLGLALIGAIGMFIALKVYPDGSLLGGWGLILGPVFWLGLLICFVSALAWIIVGLLAGFRWLSGGKSNCHGDDKSGNQTQQSEN